MWRQRSDDFLDGTAFKSGLLGAPPTVRLVGPEHRGRCAQIFANMNDRSRRERSLARSMEAILDMCRGRKGVGLREMDLPPPEHLEMHVDAREFLALCR